MHQEVSSRLRLCQSLGSYAPGHWCLSILQDEDLGGSNRELGTSLGPSAILSGLRVLTHQVLIATRGVMFYPCLVDELPEALVNLAKSPRQ